MILKFIFPCNITFYVRFDSECESHIDRPRFSFEIPLIVYNSAAKICIKLPGSYAFHGPSDAGVEEMHMLKNHYLKIFTLQIYSQSKHCSTLT